ncbi:phage tail sheath subtilisin-like domain-containing protein [Paraburkholderia xenovorans]|uniref:phage tail sheath family protein n=1 Tax=Paraburkholderia xenovorans TaxID=36873 RepID=UPI0038BA9BB0
MMGISQPDITFSEEVVPNQVDEIASAVPLFIGYTEKGSTYSLVQISSFSDFEDEFGEVSTGSSVLYYAVKHYFDNGGTSGFVLSLGTYSALDGITPDALIAAFSDSRISEVVAQEDSITLAAIPDMVLLADDDSTHWAQAWLALLTICAARRGVFGLIDTPDTADNASACLASFTGNYPSNPEWGAAYWPRLVTGYGTDDQNPVVVPPSAALAATIEYTDQTTGVWKAPANVALAQVVKPSQSWLQSEGLFQTDGASINLIRSFAGRGTRVWGCRTLTSDINSPWLYVQIRRAVAYIEAELSQIGRHFMFENNNALTWIKFKGLAHIWLREFWLDGGLYGTEEKDAFYIQIGLNETMTEDDITQGKMIMTVGLAMTYPAEFIVVSLAFDTRLNLMQQPESVSAGAR